MSKGRDWYDPSSVRERKMQEERKIAEWNTEHTPKGYTYIDGRYVPDNKAKAGQNRP